MILEKNTGDRFSHVLPAWAGQPVVIVAGGPSLTVGQVWEASQAHAAGAVKGIAVNNAYLCAHWADVHYAADVHWHKWHTDGVDLPVLGLTAAQVRGQWAEFAGERCTIENKKGVVKDPRVHCLRCFGYPEKQHSYGLSADPHTLVTGRNSGWQAINLAVLAGSRFLILLGYDGQPGPLGKSHWHGDHPKVTTEDAYADFRKSFTRGQAALDAAGVRVISCSDHSAVECFEHMTIEKALQQCTESAAVPV